jgi:transposase
MANRPIPMSKLKHILKLHHSGTSILQTSTLTGTSRNTIKRYLATLHALGLSWEELSLKSDHELDLLFCQEPPQAPEDRLVTLHGFLQQNEKLLRKRHTTIGSLFELYRTTHVDGFGKTAFYRHYNLWSQRTSGSLHVEHKAGDKVFVDFAGEKVSYVEPTTGVIKEAQVFLATLGASQMTYIEAVESQRVEDFIACCENALQYYGGSPRAIVPDNLKAAVIKPHRFEPQLNENFEAFADHYGMTVLPARAYKPKDKALVEGTVKLAYRKIYAALPTTLPVGLDALNAELHRLLDHYNGQLFSGRTYSRRDQFAEIEAETLQPLPAERFELRRSLQASVLKNGHINLAPDKHYYSVPYAFIGRKVRVFYNKSRVEIFYRHQVIAEHQRIRTAYQYTSVADHLASHHRVLSEWSPQYFLEKARTISPVVEDYIGKVLLRRHHPEQAFKSCRGILSFARRLGEKRLIAACQRGDAFGMYTYRGIEEILMKGLDQQDSDDQQSTMPNHKNVRGKDYYAIGRTQPQSQDSSNE